MNKDWVYSKVAPQAIDVEQAILGAILLEKGAFDRAAEILKAEMFYTDAHKDIFDSMSTLSTKYQPIDYLTVSEELKKNGALEIAGGEYYLHQLTTHVVSSAHLESHCRIVLQKYVQREMIRVGGLIIKQAYEEVTDVFDLINNAETAFSEISNSLDFGDMVGIDKVIVETVQQVMDWSQMDRTVTGVPSGFKELDKATRGWQDGDLIILAARPATGKTALALNVAMNAAAAGKEVALFSLEMKAMRLVMRMLASYGVITLYDLQTGRINEEVMKRLYKEAIQKLANLGIKFDDRSGLTIQKLRSKCRKLKRRGKLGLIIIDYLQLMTPGKAGTREQEVSQISRQLKQLAQELDVPVIALSQLSRAIESRTGAARVPQLSDLRESGSLEQDADMVLFLYGPTDEEVKQNASLYSRRWVKVAKNRDGWLITADLDFKSEYQLFTSADNSHFEPPVGLTPLRNFSEPIRPFNDEEDPF